ncbi:MAG: ketosynthase [Thiohalophilus sp.]|uniref:ketosynthase n=1 Tax=Thiohalophilus sp. TaxID=3028392 RepID=UPI0028707FFD|nr:ketosynthase [Thiohalophilus sp.]MDR9437177.1 ketosynthase [Thiohalophilus sp.]
MHKLAGVARRASSLLVIVYPVAVHYGVVTGHFLPAILALAVLAAVLAGWRAQGFRYLPALLVAAAISLFGWTLQDRFELLIWPPLLIYFGLATVFALSLLPGHEPLVTRFARLLDGEPDPAVRRYTRNVTLAWVLFLSLLGVISVLLVCCASRQWWSLFTNLLGYLLVLLFFLAEFVLRRRRFPQRARYSFIGFMRAMARLGTRGDWK